MLGIIKRLAGEFRDLYTLKILNVSLVRSKLEYACCVWQPFYSVYIDRIDGDPAGSIKFRKWEGVRIYI
jgi:hypothetical protein